MLCDIWSDRPTVAELVDVDRNAVSFADAELADAERTMLASIDAEDPDSRFDVDRDPNLFGFLPSSGA